MKHVSEAKHYSEMSLQEYNEAKASGMFWEVWPDATGNPDEDLECVVVDIDSYCTGKARVDSLGFIIGVDDVTKRTRYFYDIIDEEAVYDF